MFSAAKRPFYTWTKNYRGRIKACILDWSGTVTDRYVIAPAIVFQRVFEKHDVPITMEQAREPMGLRKDLHIAQILENTDVKRDWIAQFGRAPTKNDVTTLFADFVPMQLECLKQYSDLLQGVPTTIDHLRKDNIRIGMTTGFTRPMVDLLLKYSKNQGFEPDVNVAGDEVKNGARPKPHMLYRNLDLLNIDDMKSVVKVDDTVSGVGEGLNAGCWTVGVSRYSNYMNINSYEEEQQISATDMNMRHDKSKQILTNSGAHYVIDSITELPNVVKDINKKINLGIKP